MNRRIARKIVKYNHWSGRCGTMTTYPLHLIQKAYQTLGIREGSGWGVAQVGIKAPEHRVWNTHKRHYLYCKSFRYRVRHSTGGLDLPKWALEKDTLYVENASCGYFVTGVQHRIRNLLRPECRVTVEYFHSYEDEE